MSTVAVFLIAGVTTAAATAVPGLNVMAVVTVSLKRGTRGGWMTSLGAATTLFVYMMAIGFLRQGLGTMDPRIGAALHFVAAVIMIYFSVRFFRSGISAGRGDLSLTNSRVAWRGGDLKSFTTGATTCALNPKTLTWSAAVVISALHHVPDVFAFQIGVVLEMTLVMLLILAAWSVVVQRYSKLSANGRFVRALFFGSGIVFGAAGLFTALSVILKVRHVASL